MSSENLTDHLVIQEFNEVLSNGVGPIGQFKKNLIIENIIELNIVFNL